MKNKIKNIECRLLQILLGALRVKFWNALDIIALNLPHYKFIMVYRCLVQCKITRIFSLFVNFGVYYPKLTEILLFMVCTFSWLVLYYVSTERFVCNGFHENSGRHICDIFRKTNNLRCRLLILKGNWNTFRGCNRFKIVFFFLPLKRSLIGKEGICSAWQQIISF